MNKGKIVFFLVAFLFSCEKPVDDFQSHNFLKLFGTGYESRGSDVIKLSDDSYVLTGYDDAEQGDRQVLCVKADKYGIQQWSFQCGMSDVDEEGIVVKEVSDGYLFAGVGTRTNGLTQSFILKTGLSGDSVWYKQIDTLNISIEINDMVVGNDGIYVCGKADQSGNNNYEYFSARLNMNGDLMWHRFRFINSNSEFKRIFLSGSNVILVGDDGTENDISVVAISRENGGDLYFDHISSTTGEIIADARMIDGNLHILANTSTYTKLIKLDSDNSVTWETGEISAITGKTFTSFGSSSYLLFGESVVAGETVINTFSIDDGGNIISGDNEFRAINGVISSVRRTGDGGIILVGSTDNATFGINAQLIKTGEGLYLLKP